MKNAFLSQSLGSIHWQWPALDQLGVASATHPAPEVLSSAKHPEFEVPGTDLHLLSNTQCLEVP